MSPLHREPPSGPPRLAPPDVVEEEVASDLEKTRIGDAPAPLVFQTLAHHPRLMRRMNALGGAFMRSQHVDARAREVVILRIAWRSGCAYELAQHVPIARAAGLEVGEIAAIVGGDPTVLSEREQLLVRLADALEDGVAIDDATYGELSAGWSTEGVLELLTLAGFYRMLAGVLNGLRVPIDAWLREDDSWETSKGLLALD